MGHAGPRWGLAVPSDRVSTEPGQLPHCVRGILGQMLVMGALSTVCLRTVIDNAQRRNRSECAQELGDQDRNHASRSDPRERRCQGPSQRHSWIGEAGRGGEPIRARDVGTDGDPTNPICPERTTVKITSTKPNVAMTSITPTLRQKCLRGQQPSGRDITWNGTRAEVKILSSARCRAGVSHLVRRLQVSKRRARRLLNQHRSTQRCWAVAVDYERRLLKVRAALVPIHSQASAAHLLSSRHQAY